MVDGHHNGLTLAVVRFDPRLILAVLLQQTCIPLVLQTLVAAGNWVMPVEAERWCQDAVLGTDFHGELRVLGRTHR